MFHCLHIQEVESRLLAFIYLFLNNRIIKCLLRLLGRYDNYVYVGISNHHIYTCASNYK